jgi:Zn-dependent M28 family amino/carboxypeptidase
VPQCLPSLQKFACIVALPYIVGACRSTPETRARPEFVSDARSLETQQKSTADSLRAHVVHLADKIGGRDVQHLAQLRACEHYLRSTWEAQGFKVLLRPYVARNIEVNNIEIEIAGAVSPDEIVVIGAHYDSAEGLPGANDNASGVAALLEISRRWSGRSSAKTLRFVAFVNEEPPFFQSEKMGSLIYARACRDRGEKIVAMLSLETMGYYDDTPGSQHYPALLAPFYPDRGNFIAFVSNGTSRSLVRRVQSTFAKHSSFPTQSIAASDIIPGIGWSDHWSFFELGYPSLMVTDTAPNRYPYYHTAADTPEKLDYSRLAAVVLGLSHVIDELVRAP